MGEIYAWFSIFRGGGYQRLPDWKYCLSFSFFFSALFSVLVIFTSAFAQDFSHALRLVRFFYSTELEVSSS